MPKKRKKKKRSWRERQRERQIRQQKAQEAYRIQREREAERKPRQWPKGKVLGAICLISLVVVAYGAWQYTLGCLEIIVGLVARVFGSFFVLIFSLLMVILHLE